ncbi:MAG: bile acid:sodium symporter family protein [Solirubrobacterales bacterium]
MEDSIMATVVLPAALAVIMVGLGLELTTGDFRRVASQPRGAAIGLLNLLVISPLLAFAVAEIYSLPAGLAVGLVLLGTSPGGTMANLLTHLARGDTALSITLTATSSAAAVVTVPVFLQLAIDRFGAEELTGDVGMLGIVVRVLLVTVIPLAVGMWVHANRTELAQRIAGPFKRISLTIFVLVVVGVIIAENDLVLDNFDDVAAAALTLNVAAMAISFTVARIARLDNRQSTAIAIELGVHNSTLAIAVGASLATVLTIPAAVYASFMFVTAGLFARLMYVRNSRPEA